jgi:hypothetical protein
MVKFFLKEKERNEGRRKEGRKEKTLQKLALTKWRYMIYLRRIQNIHHKNSQ